MDRRRFLSLLAASAAGLALDPERLLWVPGQRTIFLPALKPSLVSPVALTKGDVFTIAGVYSVNPVPMLQQFVITDDVTAGEVSLASICPRIITDGPYQNVAGVVTPHAKIQPLFVGQTIPTTFEWREAQHG